MSSLEPERGFHSTLSTTVALNSPGSDCSFFALYTFPQSIIIDRYELVDHHISFEFFGESSLELPVFALDQSANSILLVNATPADTHSKQVMIRIPVHARYGDPGMAQKSITIPSPACFWACPPSASASTALSSEPPVANSTMLSSLKHFSLPSVSSHYATLHIPVASKHDMFPVETGTPIIVLVAFLLLVYRSCRVANTLQSRRLKVQ